MKIAVIFSRHSEALFNKNSKRTYGGGEIQMYNLAKEFANYVETFSFIQDYDEINFDEDKRFNLIKTFKDRDNLLIKFLKLKKAILKIKPNVLIQRGVTPYSYFLAKYCRLKGIKFVLMFGHDIEAVGIYQSSLKKCWTFKGLIRNSNKVIVQNSFQKGKIVELNKEVYILKKGLDLKGLKTLQNVKRYDGLLISRSEPWKNVDVFLDLVEKKPKLKFAIVLTKTLHNEELFFKIKKRAILLKNLNYFENITNKEIYDLMNQTKVLLFTSEMEGDWPMVVLEAAAIGLPILSYNLNYDYLIDDYEGGVFSEGDFEKFSSNFEQLISNRKQYLKMSKNAKRYIKENHDLNFIVKKYLDIIKK